MTFYAEALESKFEAARVSARARDDGFERVGHRSAFGKYERWALGRAQPYWWSDEICKAVLESSLSLPDDTAINLERYEVGSSVWFWFEQELSLIPGRPPFRGLLCSVEQSPTPRRDGDYSDRSVMLTTYGREKDVLEALDTLVLTDKMPLQRVITDGHTMTPEKMESLRTALRSEGYRDSSGPLASVALLRFFVSALLWVEQEIVSIGTERPNRAASKRIERAGLVESDIKVVELRRRRTESTSDSEHPIEWTCRWIVRGHWRQQYYHSTGERRPIWILPHVKGPDDMPLKAPKPIVFAVTR